MFYVDVVVVHDVMTSEFLSFIDSEDAEDRRCGDSLQVHELCESTLKVSITEGDIAKVYRLGVPETVKILSLIHISEPTRPY